MGLVTARLPYTRYVKSCQRPLDAIVWDDFDRPDGSALGNAVGGQAWTAHAGTWETREGRARITAATADAVATVDIAADLEAEADIKTGIDSVVAAIAFRFSDTSNLLEFENDSRAAELNFDVWKKQAGAWSKLGGWAGSADAGTFYRMKVSARGPNIKAYVDGVERLSLAETFNQTATRVGMFTNKLPNDNSNCRWDNFSVRLLT